MSRKSKGLNAEREIVHLFWKTGNWAAIRVAGSGSIGYPAPDVLAGNGSKVLAIECKSSKNGSQYLSDREIDELKKYSQVFGAEAVVGVRFDNNGWFFFNVDDLRKTGKHYATSLEDAKRVGRRFDKFIEEIEKA